MRARIIRGMNGVRGVLVLSRIYRGRLVGLVRWLRVGLLGIHIIPIAIEMKGRRSWLLRIKEGITRLWDSTRKELRGNDLGKLKVVEARGEIWELLPNQQRVDSAEKKLGRTKIEVVHQTQESAKKKRSWWRRLFER